MSGARGRGTGRSGARALRTAAAAAALGLALTSCGSSRPPAATASPTGTPVTVAHAGTPLQSAVAAVLERALRLRGHAVTRPAKGADAPERPWAEAGGDTVAVVDTLALALTSAPERVLPDVPKPSPSPTRTATATATPPAGATVPAPADPSATPAPPTKLPSGERAPDAAALRGLVDEALAAQAADGAAGTRRSTVSASPGASSPVASPPARVLAASREPLRVAAVVSAATAARLELDSIDDLNARCEPLVAAAPAAVNAAEPDEATALLRARLDRLSGCRPDAWLPAESAPLPALVADEAQVGLAYRFDPEIQANALVALDDGERVLPEGQVAVVGDPEALDAGVQDALREVMDRLDEEGLRELARLTTGPDALPAEEAAQYWLVSRGMEEAPEDWFVPRGSWF